MPLQLLLFHSWVTPGKKPRWFVWTGEPQPLTAWEV